MNRTAFFASVRTSLFRDWMTSSQVEGITAILDAMDTHASADIRIRAYMLATTYHETGFKMQPVEEVGHGRGHAYGVPTGPWHQAYYGRGDVQETWLINYEHATTKLIAHGVIGADVNLAKTPGLMLRPDIAAATLIYGMQEGWFTGRKLSTYIHSMLTDYVNARRVINGTDRAVTIAGYANHFHDAFVAPATKLAA